MTGGVLFFIAFVLISIGLHEFGHYVTARWFDMKVHRFFIGFGPPLWSIRRGETEYGIAVLPLGGYVKIAGMSPLEEIPEEDRDRTFKAKPPLQRAIVLAAGSTTHFLLAFLIMGIIFALMPRAGDPTLVLSSVPEELEPGRRSPAAEAGMRPGDEIQTIDGRAVGNWQEAVTVIQARPGERVSIEVLRDGERLTVRPTLAAVERDGEMRGFLGVSPEVEELPRSLPAALGESGYRVGWGAWESLKGIQRIFSPATFQRLFAVAAGREERTLEDPVSLVGIGRVSGDLAQEGAWPELFLLVAFFNIFIGVVNLLPLPPLDGGHLAVLAYEKARRRDVDIRKLVPVSVAVISIFATLFFLLLYLDIVQPLPLPG